MNCKRCGAMIFQVASFCPYCGAPINGDNPHRPGVETVQVKCKSCNSIMDIDIDKGIATCPFCGSAELISESADITVERLRMKAEMVRRQAEADRLRFQWDVVDQQEQKDAAYEFKSRKSSKVILVAAFFILLPSMVNFEDHPFARIVGILSGVSLLFSWIVGVNAVKKVRQNSYIIFTLAGVLLFFASLYLL